MAIYKGTSRVASLFAGSTPIGRVYKGNTLVFDKGAVPTTEMQFVGGTTAQVTGGSGAVLLDLTTLTGGIANAPAQGDLVIVAFELGNSISGGRPGSINTTGYVGLGDLFQDSGQNTNFNVFLKTMGAVPDTSISYNRPGTSQAAALAVHVWRGVDQVTQLDVAPTTDGNIGTNETNPPAIEPVTPGAVILVCGGSNYTVAYSPPSDLENFFTIVADGSSDARVGIGSTVWGGAGPFDPEIWPGVVGSRAWAAYTLALRPAA